MTGSKVSYILHADDDAEDHEMFREVIEQMGVQVQPLLFENGLALLDHLERLAPADELPRCIVLDIKMPMFDGIKTLKTIREDRRYATVPVIMLTTSNDPREREQCLALGANAFFSKPLDQSDLQELARQLSRYLQ